MNFEAGALACLPTMAPFLFRVDRAALGHSSLTQFQLTEFGDSDETEEEYWFETEECRAPIGRGPWRLMRRDDPWIPGQVS